MVFLEVDPVRELLEVLTCFPSMIYLGNEENALGRCWQRKLDLYLVGNGKLWKRYEQGNELSRGQLEEDYSGSRWISEGVFGPRSMPGVILERGGALAIPGTFILFYI